MKKFIIIIGVFAVFSHYIAAQHAYITQSPIIQNEVQVQACEIFAPEVVCVGQSITIQFEENLNYTNVNVSAFTVENNINVDAIINVSDNTADIIFLQEGDGEIIVTYLDGSQIVSVCNSNIYIFDGGPVDNLGSIAEIIGDIKACGPVSLDFQTFINCSDCPTYWTINDEIFDPILSSSSNGNTQNFIGNISIDEFGHYTICQQTLTPDSLCFAKDCIQVDIEELDVEPAFEVDGAATAICAGTSLNFTNTTQTENPDIGYIWTVHYDTLKWTYKQEELSFDFYEAGEYIISLQYVLDQDGNCFSTSVDDTITVTSSAIPTISCNSNSCETDIFYYRSNVDCGIKTWSIDETLGQIIDQDSLGISVQWFDTDTYQLTFVNLEVDDCNADICGTAQLPISLFPNAAFISGNESICDRSIHEYSIAPIPDATYEWAITIIDSIAGPTPEIVEDNGNNVSVNFGQFVGVISITASASIPDRSCFVQGAKEVTSFVIYGNDDLCVEDLYRARVLPEIEEDITWTVTGPNGYFNSQTKPGDEQYFTFGFEASGTYNVSIAIQDLDFECGTEQSFNVLEKPEIIVDGPVAICPGDSAVYSVLNSGANDVITWTVFQNNGTFTFEGLELRTLWDENGGPYTLKVEMERQVMPDQFCIAEEVILPIQVINTSGFEILGPDSLCYDQRTRYIFSDSSLTNFIWDIDPPNIGSILNGDTLHYINTQWHYAESIPSATVSVSTEVCGEIIELEKEVTFVDYIPQIVFPDSLCIGETAIMSIEDLNTFTFTEFYIDGLLVETDAFSHVASISDSGWHYLAVSVENPNGCPGIYNDSDSVYIKYVPDIDLSLSLPINQCPKDSFMTVIATASPQDPNNYYTWTVDDDTLKIGFGTPENYTFDITKEFIDQEKKQLTLSIDYPNGCSSLINRTLNYECEPIIACACPASGNLESVTRDSCNVISAIGTVDFNTIASVIWIITDGFGSYELPINDNADLILDNFELHPDATSASVTLSATCYDIQIDSATGLADTMICKVNFGTENLQIWNPNLEATIICQDDGLFTANITEDRYNPTSTPNFTLDWQIGSQSSNEYVITLEDLTELSTIPIIITQCDLSGTYCCTSLDTLRIPEKFDPQILTPSGTCEGEVWTFVTDQDSSTIVATTWDFFDGTGSTLIGTSKTFDNADGQIISVLQIDEDGCIGSDTIMVTATPNLIAGDIIVEGDACSPFAEIAFDNTGESTIINYQWSDPAAPNDSIFTIDKSGLYQLEVEDEYGCTKEYEKLALVNESFEGGLSYKEENCGSAFVFFNQNPNYEYQWYIDDLPEEIENSTTITELGEHTIKIFSFDDGVLCDSLEGTFTIYPRPTPPIISNNTIFCQPFIEELTVTNYDSVLWTSSLDISQTGQSIQVSQNGLYFANYVDSNGCMSEVTINVNRQSPSFDFIGDVCVQACREDLDSLQIDIPGSEVSYTYWEWTSQDTSGQNYIVDSGNGQVNGITIDTNMHNFLMLQVQSDDCIYSSQVYPLDIITCAPIIDEEEEEIICTPASIFSSNCGATIYECLLSEENGGPKYLFEGSITIPDGGQLCNEDSLDVSIENGTLQIFDFHAHVLENGNISIDYEANIIIENVDSFFVNDALLTFQFCDEDGENTYCVEFTLPYRSCEVDFACPIEYMGLRAGKDNDILARYCINLHEVSQSNCDLDSYTISANLMGNNNKQIYEESIEGPFDQKRCVDISISIEDYLSGDYSCLEMFIEGDCPGISCSNLQCGFLGSGKSSDTSNDIGIEPELAQLEMEFTAQMNAEIQVYPIPSSGIFNISGYEFNQGMIVDIYDARGNFLHTQPLSSIGKTKVNLNDQVSGLYFLLIKIDGVLIETKKVILIK